MNAEVQRESIETVLLECESVWKGLGTPASEIEDMKSELGEQLREAVADGKTVESVVGPDSFRFALEWGAPRRPRRSSREESLKHARDYSLAAAGVLLAGHLRHRSLDFPYDLRRIANRSVLSVIIQLTTAMSLKSRLLQENPEVEFDGLVWKEIAASAVSTLAPVVALGVNLSVKGGDRSAFSSWSWRATAVMLFTTAALFWAQRAEEESR